MESILARHATGEPGCVVEVNGGEGGLMFRSRTGKTEVLYAGRV